MFSCESFQLALVQLRKNRRAKCESLVTWDAGDGWRGEGYYCARRNRIVMCARRIDNPGIAIF